MIRKILNSATKDKVKDQEKIVRLNPLEFVGMRHGSTAPGARPDRGAHLLPSLFPGQFAFTDRKTFRERLQRHAEGDARLPLHISPSFLAPNFDKRKNGTTSDSVGER